MTSNSKFTAQPAALKNPLRVAGLPVPVAAFSPPAPAAAEQGEKPANSAQSPQATRKMMISEFAGWLRSRTNKHKRPFQEDTITAYCDAAVALDSWMTGTGLETDFTGCDTTALNGFFRSYLSEHSQGGTNTKQRNLRHLFTWLENTYDHPHPYTDDLQRYGPQSNRPVTLDTEFIAALLETTGGGRAQDFENARDHAMIRMLTEGVRRAELVQQRIDDLPENLITSPYVRVVPLKGARAENGGRVVPLSMATARAFAVYLRTRRGHRRAESSPALWLGTRNRGPITGSGVYRMVKRRALEAGYHPSVHPHQFRHTFAHDWLCGGGSEGDLMRLMGWKERAMLDRYGADLQVQRAIEAKQRRGDIY